MDDQVPERPSTGARPPVSDGSVTVGRVTPAQHQQLIDLALRRLPHFTRTEVAWPFESPEVFDSLTTAAAVDDAGRVVGWGAALRPGFAPAERSFLRVIVDSEHEGRGVGRALHDHLLPHVPATTTRLGAAVFDDEPRGLEVARHWGFEIEEHAIESSLDLTFPEPSPPTPPDGVTLHEAADLVFDDPDDVDRMLLASQTNPEAAAGFVMTREKFAKLTTADEVPICVIARVDGRPAGITYGTVNDGALYIAYSGVDPALRGRGLMSLVKQQAHVVAARAGATVSHTTNEEHNAGIRRINADLGYVVRSGVYRMVQQHRP